MEWDGMSWLTFPMFRPIFFHEDSWCHVYQSPLGFTTCLQRHQLVRPTSVRSEVTASTRNMWRSTSASIQGCDHLKNLPSLKCLGSFTSDTDRQHLKAFLRRSVHSRLCPPELSDMTELVEAADGSSSRTIIFCQVFLPPKSYGCYNVHKKPHNRELLMKNTRLFDCNFIVHLLYKNCY